MESLSQATLDPALFTFTPNNNSIGLDESPVMARHSHLNNLSASSHARHQSVPVIPSPQQGSGHERQCSRGLAKLTLVERLSRESIPSPENTYARSPRSLSPVRFDDVSPRPTHSPRKNRMSLSIPATKTASASVTAGPSTIASPLQSTPLAPTPLMSPSKHVSQGSLSDITLSPNPLYAHERGMTSPTLSYLEEVATLDDANATFLTLIAFQERRVVELREELARAESELDFLKQQWTRQQLKLTGTARQEHVRQNSLTKLEHQLAAGGTPRNLEDGVGQFKSPQILAAGRKLAEGVRDGLYGMMEDLKAAAASESVQTMRRHRTGSLTKGEPTEEDPPLRYPKQRSSSPMKRNVSRESEDSNVTTDMTSIGSPSTRASSISSNASIKSSSVTAISPDQSMSPWAWSMATRILQQSQRHATTVFGAVERHLDALAAGADMPLVQHRRQPPRPRYPSANHVRTDTVQF